MNFLKIALGAALSAAGSAGPYIGAANAVAAHLKGSVDVAKLEGVVTTAVLQGKDRKGILAALVAEAPAIFSHPEYADALKAVLGLVDALQAIHAKATAA